MLYKTGLIALATGTTAAALKETFHSINQPREDGLTGTPYSAFVSFSIEFSSFPDFAGNHSHPNKFSYNLLNNLKDILGDYPYIRVGGNTQDFALYNASQKQQLIGIVDPDRSPDYPTTITIGPSFFESYDTWPGVQYSHGLNLALGGNNTSGWKTLLETVPLVCKALGRGKLYTWEYGNEPDLYSTSAQGPTRPKPQWTEKEYVKQWQNGTDEIAKQVSKHCSYGSRPKYMAPSFAGLSNALNATIAWWDGLNKKRNIEYFSTHNYISGATSPGVTLQGTLMNHTMTRLSVDAHVAEWNRTFAGKQAKAPLIFGETNSLYNQGKPGLSNSFGAALWGVDFNLYSAAVGFKRVHMHQGTNYRYQAWQPVDTELATIGTKAPYYGSIAVASMLGSEGEKVSISELPLGSDTAESAYVAHSRSGGRDDDSRHGGGSAKLRRITVINMRGYNTTADGEGISPLPSPPSPRPVRTYTFRVGDSGVRDGASVGVHRLMANGSDAITGITFDGWSYNWDLDEGKPVQLRNVTTGERVKVSKGKVSVRVPDSSAALLSF